MVSCEKVKFDDDFLEGQPDERRLIQTVNVGSEQNEVMELGTGRFLFMFSGAPASRYWRDPAPRGGHPAYSPRPGRPPQGAELHPSRGFTARGWIRKKIPRPPEGRSGGELPRGVEPIRRGSGRGRRTSWDGRGAGSSRLRRCRTVSSAYRRNRRSTRCLCSVRRRRSGWLRCRPR